MKALAIPITTDKMYIKTFMLIGRESTTALQNSHRRPPTEKMAFNL